jgi:predicted  nucleic acid-binding Zn-ribbon protein
MSTAAVLRELHRIHIQLSDLRERQDRGPKQIKAHEVNVARSEAEVTRVKNEQKAARMAADQKQLQLKSGEGKIIDLRVKLNQAKTNREYQALRDQIAADEMANSVLQDEILESMEKAEELKKAVAEIEQKHAKAKEEMARVQQSIRDQQGLVDADVKRLEAELIEAEKRLPEDFREQYTRHIRGRGADAMAMVEGENCGGCYQVLTANLMSKLMMDNTVQCQVCGRMLYLPEDRSPGAKRGKK